MSFNKTFLLRPISFDAFNVYSFLRLTIVNAHTHTLHMYIPSTLH